MEKAKTNLRPATTLVHGGTMRSGFGEMSEAIFLTQGYAYQSMEQAEARFKNLEPGFIYSRYSNPTVAMFEERMALLEGAEAARATASGMAAVMAAVMGQVKRRRPRRGVPRPVRLVPLHHRGRAAALRRRDDAGRRRRPRAVARRRCGPTTKVAVPRNADQSDARRSTTSRAIADIAHGGGAKLVVDNVFSTPLLQRPMAARCRLRRLFHDQARRWCTAAASVG